MEGRQGERRWAKRSGLGEGKAGGEPKLTIAHGSSTVDTHHGDVVLRIPQLLNQVLQREGPGAGCVGTGMNG